MTGNKAMRKPATRLALLLVLTLGVPAFSSALPTDMSDIDPDIPRGGNGPSVSSVWDTKEAVPAPVVVKPQEAAPPSAPERTPSANPLWAIPLATLSATRERPIFSPSRRPRPPVVTSVPAAKAPPPPKPPRVERPQLSLVGTISSGDQSFGIFVDQATKAALRLKIGEDYQGWKLRSVQGREATLERDRQTTVFSLPQSGAGAPGQVHVQAENAATRGPADATPQHGSRR
jgi:general secretion pathway protein N